MKTAGRLSQSLIAFLFAVVFWPVDAHSTEWTVVPENSTISFSGSHAGQKFKGVFKIWTAEVSFDPENLSASRADVRVDLASAETGDATYDKTLPTADWFHIKKFAEGRFIATDFEALGGNKFAAKGSLELRGIDVPVTLTFDFVADGDTAKLNGQVTLQRLNHKIGLDSDATGAWVSLDIPVTIDVLMKPRS